MNWKALTLAVAVLAAADNVQAGELPVGTQAESASVSVENAQVAFVHAHWDVYYLWWNGRYWQTIHHGEYHSYAQAVEAWRYLYYTLGYTTARVEYHAGY